jgi:hypothetical protein
MGRALKVGWGGCTQSDTQLHSLLDDEASEDPLLARLKAKSAMLERAISAYNDGGDGDKAALGETVRQAAEEAKSSVSDVNRCWVTVKSSVSDVNRCWVTVKSSVSDVNRCWVTLRARLVMLTGAG